MVDILISNPIGPKTVLNWKYTYDIAWSWDCWSHGLKTGEPGVEPSDAPHMFY